jgi:hypothetical protein
MIELIPELQQALDANPELRMIDPRTGKVYVLIDAEVYARIQTLLAEEEEPDMRQVASLVEEAMREDDADDPALEYYQSKYGRKPRSGVAMSSLSISHSRTRDNPRSAPL